jgi:5'-nucleotidase
VGFDLQDRLVIGIASSALFDLGASDHVFRTAGAEAYASYQAEHLDEPLAPGVAMPFVRRLLSLNSLAPDADDPLVEVVILSRNSPITGLRVMRSVAHHDLPITRAIFTAGHAPYPYMRTLEMVLFLSANGDDVREAVERGFAAGQVLDSAVVDDPTDPELRIAFDFDGVLADDAAERVFAADGLDAFQGAEADAAALAHAPGPLQPFLRAVGRIREREHRYAADHPGHRPRLRVAVVTARSAPAHERAITTLAAWGIDVDDAFFLGGIAKGRIVEVLRPHLFFDDQLGHLDSAREHAAAVHVPFGIRNATIEPAR